MLTMDLEVNYIWRRRWTTFTTLFAIVRYLPVVVVGSSAATNFFPGVSAAICSAFSWVEAAGTFIILIVVQSTSTSSQMAHQSLICAQ